MTFIPVNRDDLRKLGWDALDIVFVTGDAYIDHPSFGVPLLARWLEQHGFRTGIIAQPDWRSPDAFMALGRPRLFFAVTAGAMDSMVAHYTPARKLRHDDAYTPGNRHGARPNRAVIAYTSRLKQAYKDVPVVIGGIEASLRRFAHYDFWDDAVRRSILFDAKADLLVYGMGERPVLELAQRMRGGAQLIQLHGIRGTAHVGASVPDGAVVIPSFEDVAARTDAYCDAFRRIDAEQNPWHGRTIVQPHGTRQLVCNPPSLPLTEHEMDAVYALPFEREPHPSYREPIPAFEQIKLSITSHRGCFGGCAFCAIAHHQGRVIQSRSEASISAEIVRITKKRWFKGTISDIGGPTANMYGSTGADMKACRACRRASCIHPALCKNLHVADKRAAGLLRTVRHLPGVRHAAVASGIRYDLLEHQPSYRAELLSHHVGGLLKVAPEHLVDPVTAAMRKPGRKVFERFLAQFRDESRKAGRDQHVVPYLISGHPGCTVDDMVELALALRKLGLKVEQVQDFTPTPGTLSTCMFCTGMDPATGRTIHVARTDREKGLQKSILLMHLPDERDRALCGLRAMGRDDLIERMRIETRYRSTKTR